MVGRSFSQTFLAVVESRGVSLNQLATWLTDHDCPIHRSTLGRWRDGDNLPDVSHLPVLQLLPDALGLTAAEADAFLRDVGATLGFRVPRAQPGLTPDAPTLPHRLHFGADHLPPFAGRAAELAELRQLVKARRSVLITGMGGIGKTCLAQEALRTCAGDFDHGCEFLTLAPGQDGAAVIRNVAYLLGVPLAADALTADNRRETFGRLREALRGVNILFLLDDVREGEQVRDLVWELRAITWVFTSRRRLSGLGVHTVALRPPGPEDAAGIFRAHLGEMAVAGEGDDRLVGRIVSRLGSLPYALRLAAGLLTNNVVATLAELDAQLARGVGRAGTPLGKLRRLFDDLLAAVPPSARRTLLLCGVFATPAMRLAAVQAVGEAVGLRPTQADWEALADFGLVDLPDDARVALHALLHDHAGDRLRAVPHYPAIHAAYLAYFVALAEEVGRPPDSERDYRPLAPEEPELLAVAEALHAAGEWAGLRRLYPALTGYLWYVGDRRAYAQVDGWCLHAAEALSDQEWAVKILSEQGYVHKDAGEWAEAEALFRHCQTLYDATPERLIERARLRRYRAEVALGQGDAGGALALLAEADGLLRRAAPSSDLDLARMFLHSARMTVHHRRGALAAAEADGRAAEHLYHTLGGYGEFRVELGDILARRGQLDEAAQLWAAESESRDGLRDGPAHAEARLRLAWACAARGDRERAAAMASAAATLFGHYGQTARAALAGRVLAVAGGGDLPALDVLLS